MPSHRFGIGEQERFGFAAGLQVPDPAELQRGARDGIGL